MIRNLKEMGMSNREIAKEFGVSRNIVSNYTFAV
jgi:predicted transcriptional regulator